MKRILQDFYNGDLAYPWERKVFRTEENKAVYRNIENEINYFKEKMSAEDYKHLENLENLFSDAGSYEEADAFSHGFKLGVMLMCAVFMDEDEPTPNE